MNAEPAIHLNRDQYLELEKIAVGAFSPLDGFMTKTQFDAVVETMRLPDGAVFTIPVVLDVTREEQAELIDADQVDLVFEGVVVGRIWPEDFFEADRAYTARHVFGTDDQNHPGVDYFTSLQPVFVGGRVELIQRAQFDISRYELLPSETKALFKEKGWETVVGFQTRNVPHRAHEYLQRVALEMVDGLFVQPLVGRKRAGDFTPDAVLTGYETMLQNYFPANRTLLGILSTVMRYAGPREAVFHAIIRRNYGCTHFIVGRDHAGVGDYYGLYDAHALTRQFDGDLGIEIMRLHGPYYCSECDGIVTEQTCLHYGTECTQSISGTDMRRILVDGEKPDPRLMRSSIVDALAGVELFIR